MLCVLVGSPRLSRPRRREALWDLGGCLTRGGLHPGMGAAFSPRAIGLYQSPAGLREVRDIVGSPPLASLRDLYPWRSRSYLCALYLASRVCGQLMRAPPNLLCACALQQLLTAGSQITSVPVSSPRRFVNCLIV